MLRGWRDAKALSIPRQRDAKLNELPKQILMLLPLLLLLLLMLYVLYHVLVLHAYLYGGALRHPVTT